MEEYKKEECIKPTSLNNRCIAIIDSSFDERTSSEIKKGIDYLKKSGFKVLERNYIYKKYPPTLKGYKIRASLINKLFTKKSIGAMICKTGGFGAEYILKFLNYKLIKKNPKMICGYSDNTSILLHLHDKEKMVVFHGPHLISGLSNKITRKYLTKIFSEKYFPIKIKLKSFQSWKKGRVTGKVWGGCLSTMFDYISSNPNANFKDKILFIEEGYESADYLKNILNQLHKIGVYKKIKGMLIGRFLHISENELYELKQAILNYLKNKDIPVLYGFKSGHGKEKIILPFGTEVTVDATEKRVIYEEFPFEK